MKSWLIWPSQVHLNTQYAEKAATCGSFKKLVVKKKKMELTDILLGARCFAIHACVSSNYIFLELSECSSYFPKLPLHVFRDHIEQIKIALYICFNLHLKSSLLIWDIAQEGSEVVQCSIHVVISSRQNCVNRCSLF